MTGETRTAPKRIDNFNGGGEVAKISRSRAGLASRWVLALALAWLAGGCAHVKLTPVDNFVVLPRAGTEVQRVDMVFRVTAGRFAGLAVCPADSADKWPDLSGCSVTWLRKRRNGWRRPPFWDSRPDRPLLPEAPP